MNKNTDKKQSKRQRAARATFMRRSYTIYQHMRNRIRGQPYSVDVPFTLGDLRVKISAALDRPCYYCDGEVTPKTFSADHRMPLSRADEIVSILWLARLDNITICCTSCQRLKGAMDENEYRRLQTLLTEFDEIARRDITRRLKAGGAVIRCGVAKA